jgi:hypothetical protein
MLLCAKCYKELSSKSTPSSFLVKVDTRDPGIQVTFYLTLFLQPFFIGPSVVSSSVEKKRGEERARPVGNPQSGPS